MDFDPIVLSIPIYFLLIAIELFIQFFSKNPIYRLADALTNISCGITQQISGLLFKVGFIALYTLIFSQFALFEIESTWYNLIILFVAVDFCYYWAHRMSHEVNLFWGGHVVHHQSEDYNFSVALRQGSFQVIWTSLFYFPLAIIGFDPIDFVLMSALVTVYQFWIHTETIGKLGFIEYIFNTPSHHRVHHGRDPKYIDRNHAGVFIIWDRMFGTFQEEEERPTYGITTPVDSWNPVWVNFDHYQKMAGWLGRAKGMRAKMGILFRKPGWFPEEMGGYQAAPEVDKESYQKYHTATPIPLAVYILVNYLIALLGTAFFLFKQASFSIPDKALFGILLVWTVMNCGGLFERRNWVHLSESIRLLSVTVLVFYFFPALGQSMMALGMMALYYLASTFWLLNLRRVPLSPVHSAYRSSK